MARMTTSISSLSAADTELGRRGGQVRAKALPSARPQEIAKIAAAARWAKRAAAEPTVALA